jgi:signal transduction histidine kinase
MRRRLLIAILSVTTIAVVLFGVPLAILVDRLVEEEATLRVERHAVLASRTVPGDFAGNADTVELPEATDGISLALYDSTGTLVSGVGPAVADGPTLKALRNQVNDAETAGLRIVAVPIAANEQVVGAIRAEQSVSVTDARTRRIILLFGLLAAGVIAVGAAIGYLVAGRLARPVRRLRDAAVQLGDGDFSIEIPRSTVPELDQAAQALTNTARRLDDLVTRERSFSADASHQLRTPVAGLRAAIETELEFPRPDRNQVLHEALGDIDRLERTIAELLLIARTPASASESVSIADLFELVNSTWRGPLAARGRRLTLTDAHDCPLVRGNSAMLRHALDVLLDNAVRHGAGEVRVDLSATGDTVTLSVTDEGPGFAGAPANELHGLGLPLAARLVEAMPGRLVIVQRGVHPRIDVVLQRSNPSVDVPRVE